MYYSANIKLNNDFLSILHDFNIDYLLIKLARKFCLHRRFVYIVRTSVKMRKTNYAIFKEKDNGSCGFDSTWKDEKESNNQTTQTTEFRTKDQFTNTSTSVNIQTQTEEIQSNVIESVDMEKLEKFMKNAYPDMLNELEDTSIANAMASLKFTERDETVIKAKMLQQIDVFDLEASSEPKTVYASGMSWNSTGNTLAVSFSYCHKSFCHHEGLVYLYTFDRNDKLPASPTKKLKCQSCVTSLSFHPSQPSTLCAGTYSGEIYLWGNQKDQGDNLVAMVSAHDDRISLLKWVSNMDTKRPVSTLATASRDGFLFLWDVCIDDDSLVEVRQRYTTGKVGKSITSPEIHFRKSEAGGITNFDFSPHISGLFVLAMEGGTLVKCSTLGAKLQNDGDVFDPSISNFEAHDGDISSIKFSPHRKELFLSCGTDNEIKIFHIDQATPTQIIFLDSELECVSWILHEQKLLIGCGEKGSIRLYSLLNGQPIPNIQNNNSSVFSKLTINKKRFDLAAFGNKNGQIQLWSIPWNNIAVQDYKNIYSNRDSH